MYKMSRRIFLLIFLHFFLILHKTYDTISNIVTKYHKFEEA